MSGKTFEGGELLAHAPNADGTTCTVCGGSLGEADKPEDPKPETPVTGDESMLVLWSLLLVIAAMGTVATVTLKKRTTR